MGHPDPVSTRSFYHRLALMLVVTLAGLATGAWVALSRALPAWDEAWYLADGLRFHDLLLNSGFAAFARAFDSAQNGVRAPLIGALPVPLYLALGRHWKLAYAVNVAFGVNLLLCVDALTRRRRGPRAGVLAAAVVATMPLVYGLAHAYLVEYALTSLTAACVCLLCDARTLRSPARAAGLGAVVGFATLLKAFFPVYVVPVAALAAWRAWRERGRRPPVGTSR